MWLSGDVLTLIGRRTIHGVIEGDEDSWLHFRPAELRTEVGVGMVT